MVLAAVASAHGRACRIVALFLPKPLDLAVAAAGIACIAVAWLTPFLAPRRWMSPFFAALTLLPPLPAGACNAFIRRSSSAWQGCSRDWCGSRHSEHAGD